jgi:methionyl-tRNA formyltransferase
MTGVSMKIIFFGSGEFGITALKRLLDSDHDIAAVVTQPDKAKGRGYGVLPTPIKAMLEQKAPEIDVLQPEKASDPGFISDIRNTGADMFVVVDYGQILKKELLDIPLKGCVNLHPSLLPKYRGAAPINWTIINGEQETGNTVFFMDERMDAGDVVAQEKMTIGKDEPATSLFARLSQQGTELLVKALDAIENDSFTRRPQDGKAVTLAPKLKKADGEIDWKLPAEAIVRRVKGLQPWPVAYTYLGGKLLKIFDAEAVMDFSGAVTPGQVIDDGDIVVKAGTDAVKVNTLQLEGRQKLTARDFLMGYKLDRGKILG